MDGAAGFAESSRVTRSPVMISPFSCFSVMDAFQHEALPRWCWSVVYPTFARNCSLAMNAWKAWKYAFSSGEAEVKGCWNCSMEGMM